MTEEQGQGQVTSETATESGGGEQASAATATEPIVVAPSSSKGFTQKDLNKAAGAAREEGRSKALADKAQELGFASVEEMEAAVQAHKQAESERMSALEKVQKDFEKEHKRASQLEQTYQETLSKAQKATLNSEARLMALALNAKPERVNAVLSLTDFAEVSVSDDFEVDTAEGSPLAKAIQKTLEEYPEFATSAPTSVGNGGGTPPGEPPSVTPNNAWELSDEAFEDMRRRAQFGEHSVSYWK